MADMGRPAKTSGGPSAPKLLGAGKTGLRALGTAGGKLQVSGHQHIPSELAADFFQAGRRFLFARAALQVLTHQVLGWMCGRRHDGLRFCLRAGAQGAGTELLVPILEADRLAC